MAPIYPAGEKSIEGVNSEWLLKGIKEHGHREVTLKESLASILEHLLDTVSPGDVVMTLGAGNIHTVGEELLKKLGQKGAH
jgi:UDP-N-acetylmuramate--alanine ligase